MPLVRRLIRLVLIAVAGVLVLVLLSALLIQTAWVKRYLRGVAERRAEQAIGTNVAIGSLGGNLLTGVTLHNLRVGPEDRPIATVPEAEVEYSLVDLLTGAVDVSSIALRQPLIHLRRTESGVLNIAAFGADRSAAADGAASEPAGASGAKPSTDGVPSDTERPPGRGWAIGNITIEDGTLTIGNAVVRSNAVNVPERLVDLDARLDVQSRAEGGVRIGIDALSFQARSPSMTVRQAEGQIVIGPDTLRLQNLSLETDAGAVALDGAIRERQARPIYDLRIGTEDLALQKLAPLVPALEGYTLSPTIQATLQGPLEALEAQFQAKTQAGAISGDVTLDLSAPERAVRGSLQADDLNLAALQPDAGTQTDITGEATVDLQIPDDGVTGLRGSYELDASEFRYGDYQAHDVHASGRIQGREIRVDARAGIYGGTAETEGTIMLPSDGQPIEYDLDGRLRGVDPARLPANIRPPGAEALSAPASRPREQARGTGSARDVSASDDPGRPAAGGGVNLDFRLSGRGSNVEAEARLLDFSLAGADFSDATVIDVSRKDGRLVYAATGSVRSLNLRRLGRELGLEALTAERYASDVNAQFDIRGGGTELGALTLAGSATLTDSEMFGAHFPTLTVKPDLERGAGTIALDGRFAGLDVGALTGNPSLDSTLQGTVDAQLRIDNLAAPDFSLGEIEAGGRLTLGESSVAGVPIDRAVLDATLTEALARVRELTVTGPDLAIEASGSLALNQTGASEFTYLIDTPALQRFEAFGISASGDVLLKGRVTGNLARLDVNGTLSGTHVGYDETTALSINSDYDLVIPDLSIERARVAATTELSELEAAGRSFASVTARTEYAARTLEFGAAVTDEGRRLDAEGRLRWDATEQELHLRRFRFQTPDARWALASDDGAVIRYGGDSVGIQDLTLRSDAGGHVAVDGALGGPNATLTASIQNLQLDHVDDMILDEPVTGVFGGTATITGSLGAPVVDANVEVRDGAYRGFEYQRAGGTVHYTPARVRLDVRVEQSDTTFLTAEGTVPLSETAGEALDVAVQSSPIDLALVQAFTDELQQVEGTAEIDLTVRGSVASPLLDGFLHVRNGAFTVVVAQSRYTGFETDIAFEPDVLRVREFHLVDDEGNRLRVGGELALNGQKPGGVNVRIESEEFEVADNRFAELNVDTKLQVTGDLLRPQIEGTVGITGGQVRVDRILQALQGPYESRADDPAPQTGAGAFAPAVSVVLRIPDTLVIRGTDLRAPGGTPVGLGDVNITVGGELRIRKEPGEELRLAGDVQTVRGTYEFQGRQFTIERDGRIAFMGTPEINPRLDIRAQREISGVVARVRIGGVLDAPELELSSQPPMGDAEILSLIVFNQPLSLLGSGEQVSLATRATALASGFVASQLTESVGEALELDILEIETAGAEAGPLAPVLTVGEQFGQLFIKLRQRFGPEAVSKAVLEYRFAEWLRLQSSYARGDASARNLLQRIEAGGLDLLFFFSY